MPYKAEILCDSISPGGDRLTSWELQYPRMVHSELMTHRVFSRSTASSRAIPVERMIKMVEDEPVLPVYWGKTQSGMQAREELDIVSQQMCQNLWLEARNRAVMTARSMLQIGCHKQITNRVLEPWMWVTAIVTATTYDNFFRLRCHPDAQPEIKFLADMMLMAYFKSKPATVAAGYWSLPYVTPWERASLSTDVLKKISTARCARVSYSRQSRVGDEEKDIALHDQLQASGHWSPFEHVAVAVTPEDNIASSNITGWYQYRKEFITESGLFTTSEREDRRSYMCQ